MLDGVFVILTVERVVLLILVLLKRERDHFTALKRIGQLTFFIKWAM